MSKKEINVGRSVTRSRTQLVLTQYKPNLNDPRVKKRVQQALAWCESLELERRPKSIHHGKLREIFGNTGRNPGRWLLTKLLRQVGGYARGQFSFSYVLNVEGYERVHAMCGTERRSASEIVAEKYAGIISGTETVEYVDHGDRRYHPIQNLKREVRANHFDGWWDYDIEACAPTLIYQYVSVGQEEGWGTKWLPTVRRLVHDKSGMRTHVKELTNLDDGTVKRLINGLFFQMVLSPNSACLAFQLLGQNVELLYRLRSDPLIKAIRREVRFMWNVAASRYALEVARASIKEWRPRSISEKKPKLRSLIYRKLERQVMEAMETVLPDSRKGCILMHDGFLIKDRADVEVLERTVLERTGYRIRLKEAQLVKV
jgi:hypothetical protein